MRFLLALILLGGVCACERKPLGLAATPAAPATSAAPAAASVLICPDLEMAALKNIPDEVNNCYFASGIVDVSACRMRVDAYAARVARLPPSCARDAYEHWIAFYRGQLDEAWTRDETDAQANDAAAAMVKP